MKKFLSDPMSWAWIGLALAIAFITSPFAFMWWRAIRQAWKFATGPLS